MQSDLQMGCFDNGLVIRVVGRGTMRESVAFREAIDVGISRKTELLVFDATDCEYLDSTFLGCLIGIQKSCELASSRRFVIAASKSQRIKLFTTSSLDHYFDFIDVCPDLPSELTPIEINELGHAELGEHVACCHQRLAERGGPEAPVFRSIAEQLKRELGDESRN